MKLKLLRTFLILLTLVFASGMLLAGNAMSLFTSSTHKLLEYLDKNDYYDPIIVRQFLESGADPNARTQEGYSPLQLISRASGNDLDLLTSARIGFVAGQLVKAGADFDLRTDENRKLLRIAVRKETPTVVEWLLRKANLKDYEGNTILADAIYEYFRFYSLAGYRCSFGSDRPSQLIRSLKLLLDAGADVNEKTDDGKTVLLKVFLSTNSYLKSLLVTPYANFDKGVEMLYENLAELVKLFVTSGFDTTSLRNCHQTMCEVALPRRYYLCGVPLIKELFLLGIDIDLGGYLANAREPYQVEQYKQIIKQIFQPMPSTDTQFYDLHQRIAKIEDWQDLFKLAIIHDHDDIAELLLQQGFVPTRTMFLAADLIRDSAIAQLLKRYGALSWAFISTLKVVESESTFPELPIEIKLKILSLTV